jgi:hypothetical protein
MKKLKRMQISSCFVMLLVAATIVSAGVKVDWDKSATFANYKTYAWDKGTPAKSPLWDQRIIEAVDKRLPARESRKLR